MSGYQDFLNAAYGGSNQSPSQNQGPNSPASSPNGSVSGPDLPVIVPSLVAAGLNKNPQATEKESQQTSSPSAPTGPSGALRTPETLGKPVYKSFEKGPTRVNEMNSTWASRAANAVREGRREATPSVLNALDKQGAEV